MQAARGKQAVGEDMATLGVGAELDFIDRHEISADFQRHRLNRADPVLGAVGHDTFFAGDQRHNRRSALGDAAVINLARQQAQRQADDPGAVAQHAFDGVMRFPGIRRPKDRRYPRLRCHWVLQILPGSFDFQPFHAFQYPLHVGMYSEGGAINL
jgi:hypothetical protein